MIIERPFSGPWKEIKRQVDALAVKEKNARSPYFEMTISLARAPLIVSRFVLLTAFFEDLDPQLAKKALGLPEEGFEKNPPDDIKEKLRGVKILDPFAGGGSIPLEAIRLGADAVALDYNPVQWLALKTIEIIQQRHDLINLKIWEELTKRYRRGFGANMEAICNDPLAEKAGLLVKEACNIAKELKNELEKYYPLYNGKRVVHYLWAKQVKCPKCGSWVPLVLDFCLDSKKKIYWRPRYTNSDYIAEITEEFVEPTIGGGDGKCPRESCKASISNSYIRENIKNNDKLVLLITEDKSFYPAKPIDSEIVNSVPDVEDKINEQIAPNDPRSVVPPIYGYKTFGELFNKRQLYYINQLIRKIKNINDKDIRTIMSWLVAKQADRNSLLTTWDSSKVGLRNTLSHKVLRMAWDYVETNPFALGAGTIWSSLYDIIEGVAFLVKATNNTGKFRAILGSALNLPFSDKSIKYIITDPPYFDNIPYPESYDFIYVLLKRVVGDIYPEAFSYWTLWRDRSAEDISVGGGRSEEHFKYLIKLAFKEIRRVLADDGLLVLYYAHSKREAWVFVLEALIDSGFRVVNVFPIKSYSETDVQAVGKASFISSLIIVARPRLEESVAYVEKLKPLMESEIRKTVRELWEEGYRGVDLTIAAYGVALKIATQAGKLESLRGNPVESVISFADEIATKALVEFLYGGSTPDKYTAFYVYAVNNYPGGFDSDTLHLFSKTFVSGSELQRIGLIRERKKGKKKVFELVDFADRCNVAGKFPNALVDVVHAMLCKFKSGGSQAVNSYLQNARFPFTMQDVCRFIEAVYKNWGVDKNTVNNFAAMFCRSVFKDRGVLEFV
ncbi:hypothetical protein ODS41_12200 [Pyrobaculum sp. 3827-6]|uniref:hypothetical protein n=1 Tax=Pyrobaculum sp. 3827-6 TaxID=2983604 RepID=UPI0021D9D614|nr:hypothetical protein [Pyrobaculum sp. 3827-6]MCU7788675.1 hypothetical protein [Pyrobaculum sp. 3827-6]